MSAPNFFHLLWLVPIWLLASLGICRLTAVAIVKWPAAAKRIRSYCPLVFVGIIVELAVFLVFDAASAADGILWMPVLHYLNVTLGVPAFMLFCFERFFRAAAERSILLLIPVVALPVPIIFLQTLHEMYRGVYHPW